jgi:hypothetical protein
LVIVDIADFTTANAVLTTTLAGPTDADNQTASLALDSAISTLTKLARDAEQDNIHTLLGSTTNNA